MSTVSWANVAIRTAMVTACITGAVTFLLKNKKTPYWSVTIPSLIASTGASVIAILAIRPWDSGIRTFGTVVGATAMLITAVTMNVSERKKSQDDQSEAAVSLTHIAIFQSIGLMLAALITAPYPSITIRGYKL